MNDNPTLRDQSWRDQRACAKVDPAIFFPDLDLLSKSRDPGLYREAAAVCANCPVQAECLDDVLSWEVAGTRHGYAGGMPPHQREVHARRQRAAGLRKIRKPISA